MTSTNLSASAKFSTTTATHKRNGGKNTSGFSFIMVCITSYTKS